MAAGAGSSRTMRYKLLAGDCESIWCITYLVIRRNAQGMSSQIDFIVLLLTLSDYHEYRCSLGPSPERPDRSFSSDCAMHIKDPNVNDLGYISPDVSINSRAAMLTHIDRPYLIRSLMYSSPRLRMMLRLLLRGCQLEPSHARIACATIARLPPNAAARSSWCRKRTSRMYCAWLKSVPRPS